MGVVNLESKIRQIWKRTKINAVTRKDSGRHKGLSFLNNTSGQPGCRKGEYIEILC